MNEQDISTQILSDITVYMKYARYLPEHKRRETWDELVTRNMEMHLKKYPELAEDIKATYQFVYDKKVEEENKKKQIREEGFKNELRELAEQLKTEEQKTA